MSKRYQELIKENNATARFLLPSYQQVATKLIRLARGRGVKNEDTEVVIKNILEELQDYSNRNVDIKLVIPDVDKYLEDKLTYISKKVPKKYLTKEIIAIIIFCSIFIGWIVLQQWLKSDVSYKTPENVIIEELENNKIKVKWDQVNFAEEYAIYFIDTEGEESHSIYVTEPTCILELPDVLGTYEICIYVKASDVYNKSKVSKMHPRKTKKENYFQR